MGFLAILCVFSIFVSLIVSIGPKKPQYRVVNFNYSISFFFLKKSLLEIIVKSISKPLDFKLIAFEAFFNAYLHVIVIKIMLKYNIFTYLGSSCHKSPGDNG